jgi:beta-phosphoglucomutase-like phosphatase (HAD superfamily)
LALFALQTHADGGSGADPEPEHAAPIKLGAANCLVVEDSLAGIMSAKGAGMRAVGVSNTYTALELRRAGADEVIDGLATLTPDWIERRFSS